MEFRIVSSAGARRLILIYAGWAMDWHPFSNLRRSGYDIAVVWDYNDISFESVWLESYSEVCIVAWSMGVAAASATADIIGHRLTAAIAVNGTEKAVDDNVGIPAELYQATLDSLSDTSLRKFYRRVCGSATAYAEFSRNLPERGGPSLAHELEAMRDIALKHTAGNKIKWDMAIISTSDAIFPAANQRKAWNGIPTYEFDGPHIPDFQKILDSFIIDKDSAGTHFGRRRRSYDGYSSVQQNIASRLWQYCTDYGIAETIAKPTSRIMDIGSGTGALTRLVADTMHGGRLEACDLCGEPPSQVTDDNFSRGDAELLVSEFGNGAYDAILSSSTIQWFNSPQRFMRRCISKIKPGGYLAFSVFTHGTLGEVREATGRGLPMRTKAQWKSLLPEGAKLLAMDEYTDILEFDSPTEVFRHLSRTGVNSLETSGNSTQLLRQALLSYPRQSDGRCRLTYNSVIIIMQKC